MAGYSAAPNNLYDSDDSPTSDDCYGSFQIHAHSHPALSLNAWSRGRAPEMGIGTHVTDDGFQRQGNLQPDFTFAQNAGMYTTRRLRAFVGTTGEDCAEGFYKVFMTGECLRHTDCSPGLYMLEEPTATRDRSCGACPRGMFTATANTESCIRHRSCPCGEYVTVRPTSQRNRECTPCGPSETTVFANSASCVPSAGAAPCVCDRLQLDDSACPLLPSGTWDEIYDLRIPAEPVNWECVARANAYAPRATAHLIL